MLCFGCMRQKKNNPICEHCGFDERGQNLSHQLPIGTLLNGQYLVGRVLGQGGFGITYMGWDQHLSSPVAIKEYYPSGMVQRNCSWGLTVTCGNGESPELFEKHKSRFLKEARILAQLSGIPEIVQVKNYFSENGTAYIVMEYVKGITLKARLMQLGRPMTPSEALSVMEPVLTALEKVHENHLIHRDISPDNIMLPEAGGVKLIDFGTVRDLDGNRSRSTESALKPGFAPMEQYNSRGNVGPWTDVYAVCASFHYLMTGKLPPDAPSRIEEGEGLPLLDRIPGISRAMMQVLKKGLAIRSADRIQSIPELRAGLYKNGLHSRPVEKKAEKSQSKKKKTGWLPIGIFTIGAAAVLVFMMLLFAGKKEPQPLISVPEQTKSYHTVPETQPETEPSVETVPELTVPPTEPRKDWEGNVLRYDEIPYIAAGIKNYNSSKFYDTPIFRNQITEIVFLDQIPELPYTPWDVSEDRNGTVVAWIEGGPSNYLLYIAADGGINARGNACKELFAGYGKVEAIHFNGALHTDYAEDMSGMFHGCERLTNLDVSSFRTENVRSMSAMFYLCKTLDHLDLSGFDISNVTVLAGMFNNCINLTDIRFGIFDTSSVTSMQRMFLNCWNLKELDISGFDTASVENMDYMLFNCMSLEELDLSNMDTSNLRSTIQMFYQCTGLKRLDLSGWDTSGVVSMEGMFTDCHSLESLDLRNFDTSNVTNMARMIYNCKSLKSLELGEWETDSILNVYEFYHTVNLPDGTPWTKLFWP